MNCFQHALIGFTPTSTHPGVLHTRARPCPLSRHLPHAQRARAHFYPQRWLLCHVGLHLYEFEFARCPGQLSKQYDSTNSPNPRCLNSNMEAQEQGLEWHNLKAFGTVN